MSLPHISVFFYISLEMFEHQHTTFANYFFMFLITRLKWSLVGYTWTPSNVHLHFLTFFETPRLSEFFQNSYKAYFYFFTITMCSLINCNIFLKQNFTWNSIYIYNMCLLNKFSNINTRNWNISYSFFDHLILLLLCVKCFKESIRT